MRKLKLDVEHLTVESFELTRGRTAEGTVRGNLLDPNYDDAGSAFCYGGSGATGPSNPVCIGPTYCCNPTANSTCCAPLTIAQSCVSCIVTCDPCSA